MSFAVVMGESRMRIATVAVAAGEFVSIRPMRRGRDWRDSLVKDYAVRWSRPTVLGHEYIDKYIDITARAYPYSPVVVSQITDLQNRPRDIRLQLLPQRNIVAQQMKPIILNSLDDFLKSPRFVMPEIDISVCFPFDDIHVALFVYFFLFLII